MKAGIPTPNIGSVVRPGDIKYRDMNDDGVVDAKDEGYIGGTTTPRIVYGLVVMLNTRTLTLVSSSREQDRAIVLLEALSTLFQEVVKELWEMFMQTIRIAGLRKIRHKMCSGHVCQKAPTPITIMPQHGGRKT